jgi:hypothetical protein
MSKEVVDTSVEQVVETPQLTETELKASDSGWVTKDKYQGEEHKWVEAGEYLRRGELFSKIDLQNRELKEVKKALVELGKMNQSIKEIEYKKALETLKAQKKSALEEGDADAVIAADERIALVRDEQKEAAQKAASQPQDTGEGHPEFVDWTSKNTWYTNNAPMRAFADAHGQELAKRGLTPSQVLKQVELDIRKEFPTRFNSLKQGQPSKVEGGTQSGRSTGTFTLTGEERRVMNTFVKSGALTEAEYIKQIKEIRGV